VSDYFGTSKQSTSGTSTTTANPNQQPFLDFGWGQALQNFKNASSVATPDNFVAGFNPGLIDTFKNMLGYGSSYNTAATGAAGASLATSGAGASSGALTRLGMFNPSGGVDSNIAAATRYASNPDVDAMVTAAMRPAVEQAQEGALPGIARSGAANGTINSNKNMIAQGMVARDLERQQTDLGANLRGQLYSKGLDLAEGGRQFDNSSVLDSIKSLISGGNASAATGGALTSASIGQQGALYNMNQQGGQGLTDAEQQSINNILAKYGFDTTNMSNLLNNYWSTVGDLKGQTTNMNSTTKSTASPAAILGGLLTAGGSLIPGKK
jgi:hypothetical protein